MKADKSDSLELARLCCRALDAKKAGDLRVIDVGDKSSITNYLVIASATSEPHVRALRIALEQALDDSKTHVVGIESAGESGWMVVDAFDVMVHIFTPQVRERYRLEHLWRDGLEVPVGELLGSATAKPKKSAIRRRTISAKKKPRRK